MAASGVRNFSPEKLRALRTASGLTLKELAERVGDDISGQTVYKYESRHATPSPQRLKSLADALTVHPSELMDVDPAQPTIADLRVFRGLDAKALAATIGRSYESVVHPVDRGRAARELADDLVDLLAGALQVAPAQVREAYQRSRQAGHRA